MYASNRKGSLYAFGLAVGIGGLVAGCELEAKQELGKRVFNDESLSANSNQSCASCHGREVGGTGPLSALNAHGAVYEGSIHGRFGNRKPPASSYATLAPRMDYDAEAGFVGGNFWDGRATGWRLGTPAADQAQGPFLNPVEQALPDAAELVGRVCNASYGPLFLYVWGDDACADVEQAYANIALSVAAFEDSPAVNGFNSKYDAVLGGRARFSSEERQGLELFVGAGRCVDCHVMPDGDPRPLFTDFTFDNLGVPKNPENPFYQMDKVLVDGEPVNPEGADWVDRGLGEFVERLSQDSAWRSLPYVTDTVRNMPEEALEALVGENLGKHRVPTLRNVDKRPNEDFVKAYGHNGYFKSLGGIVHFYNTRDVLPRCEGDYTEAEALAADCWPAPEVEENMNMAELGDLGLSEAEEDAIVAFLGTLSDG